MSQSAVLSEMNNPWRGPEVVDGGDDRLDGHLGQQGGDVEGVDAFVGQDRAEEAVALDVVDLGGGGLADVVVLDRADALGVTDLGASWWRSRGSGRPSRCSPAWCRR